MDSISCQLGKYMPSPHRINNNNSNNNNNNHNNNHNINTNTDDISLQANKLVAELEAALEYERVRREKLEAQLDTCRDGMERLNSSKSFASGYKNKKRKRAPTRRFGRPAAPSSSSTPSRRINADFSSSSTGTRTKMIQATAPIRCGRPVAPPPLPPPPLPPPLQRDSNPPPNRRGRNQPPPGDQRPPPRDYDIRSGKVCVNSM